MLFFDIFLLLYRRGNTLIKQVNAIEIFNGNSVNKISREFKLTKLKDGLVYPARLAAPILRVRTCDLRLIKKSLQLESL